MKKATLPKHITKYNIGQLREGDMLLLKKDLHMNKGTQNSYIIKTHSKARLENLGYTLKWVDVHASPPEARVKVLDGTHSMGAEYLIEYFVLANGQNDTLKTSETLKPTRMSLLIL